ncbi:MAG: Rieske 2Fe-2S domain-containing protein, partial [Bacteroidetes bacterium]|nr:Rieske 2Fe-2S domain-containing protein [Bacteroidota bacterium]
IKAVDGLCRHMNMPIFQKGKLDGSVITCPFHGWQYDLQTLECIGKPDIYLREYETVIEHDKVYVSLTPPGGEIA